MAAGDFRRVEPGDCSGRILHDQSGRCHWPPHRHRRYASRARPAGGRHQPAGAGHQYQRGSAARPFQRRRPGPGQRAGQFDLQFVDLGSDRSVVQVAAADVFPHFGGPYLVGLGQYGTDRHYLIGDSARTQRAPGANARLSRGTWAADLRGGVLLRGAAHLPRSADGGKGGRGIARRAETEIGTANVAGDGRGRLPGHDRGRFYRRPIHGPHRRSDCRSHRPGQYLCRQYAFGPDHQPTGSGHHGGRGTYRGGGYGDREYLWQQLPECCHSTASRRLLCRWLAFGRCQCGACHDGGRRHFAELRGHHGHFVPRGKAVLDYRARCAVGGSAGTGDLVGTLRADPRPGALKSPGPRQGFNPHRSRLSVVRLERLGPRL